MVRPPRPNIEMTPELLDATAEIAGFEFERSDTHNRNTAGWHMQGQYNISPGFEFTDAVWDGARLAEERGEARLATDLFLSNPAARTATLGILRLNGRWDAANAVEASIIEDPALVGAPHFMEVYDANDDVNTKRSIRVEWGVVVAQGLTMVARRRRLGSTSPVTSVVSGIGPDASPQQFETTTQIDIDKISNFILNIERLKQVNPEAAHEVRLVLLCGLLADANLELLRQFFKEERHSWLPPELKSLSYDIKRVAAVKAQAQEYGISVSEIFSRAFEERADTPIAQLRTEEAIQTIEDEIQTPTGLLVPATATFYGERKLTGRPTLHAA